MKKPDKTKSVAEDFNFKKFVFIQGSLDLCQLFFPNKSYTQTFLTLQSKWAWEEELCLNNNSVSRRRNSRKLWIIVIQMSSLFNHINSFKITITNLNSKFYI